MQTRATYFTFPLGGCLLEAVRLRYPCHHSLTSQLLYYFNRCLEDFSFLGHRHPPSDPANAVASLRPLGLRLRGRRVQLRHRQVLRVRRWSLLAQQSLRLQRRLLPRLQDLRLRGSLRAHLDLRLRGPVRMLNNNHCHRHAQRTITHRKERAVHRNHGGI
jgi:hypothetical protein